MRQPGVFHDLASAGVSEPVQWVEREQSRDDMLQTVPQHRFFQPFIIEHQNFVEYRMARLPGTAGDKNASRVRKSLRLQR